MHLPPLERHRAWKEMLRSRRTDRAARSRRGGAALDPLAPPPGAMERRREGSEELSRILDLDVGTYLVDELLVKVDRASMAHSLETRVPFFDPVVADFALSLPAGAKVRDLRKKRLLRKALAPLVPAEILGARKQGFTLPASQWLRTSLAPVCPRDAFPRKRGQAGRLPSRGRDASARRAHWRTGRQLEAALDASGLHRLVRPLRRSRSSQSRRRSAGKSTTSRIDSRPVKSMASRSMPSPMPLVGGMP